MDQPGPSQPCSSGHSSESSGSSVDIVESFVPIESTPTTTSLLSKLKCPPSSDLARKRKIATNPPPTGMKRCKGRIAAEPKTITPAVRVKQYPDENFKVSNHSLFCTACRETLSLKKSIIDLHVKTAKHTNGKVKLKSKDKREKDIASMLKVYDKDVHPVGEHLPVETRVYRVKVLTSFLKAGVPLTKLDCFRGILEESAFNLSSSQHMRELIPFIHKEQQCEIKREITNRQVAVIYDGTTHVCEAMVVILRYIDEWVIRQRVVRMMLVAKSMSGEEVARQLISVLSTELGIPSHLLVASMRDGASVNSVAMRTLSVLYPQMFDIRCFSHTLDLVGSHLKTPVLDEFIKTWINLFSRSPNNKLIWRTLTSLKPPSYSSTRWWSKWEVIRDVLVTFGDVEAFNSNEVTSASKGKLQCILQSSQRAQLQIELAIAVDAGEPFVKCTYNLEGDGPLSLTCYEQISELKHAISLAHYPNTVAMATKLSNGNTALFTQLTDYAKGCVQPAYQYFDLKFGTDLKDTLQAFKCARLFDPSKVTELQPSASDVDSLKIIPFLKDTAVINGLKSELATYLAKAEDVSSTVSKTEWWKQHSQDLPRWSSACQLVLLMQPSSAAAERAFSLLTNSFNDEQKRSLEDYIELSIMLQYNQ